ncbi:MAG: MFS transporter [Acetobacteraceae bacterium]
MVLTRRPIVISVLGAGQILSWGSSYYLPAVLAKPTAQATGWPLSWVIGGLSVGILVSGVVSPRVGTLIERRGGRPVLAASAILLAAGLLCLAAASSITMMILAWIIIGAGMGAGLYDPAFATLGRLYGREARTAITSLTLIGGFASTLAWPLSAWLLTRFGWRGTCAAYAVLNAGVALPLYWFGLPREQVREVSTAAARPARPKSERTRRLAILAVLAAGLTLSSVIAVVVSVHVLTIFQALGLPLATAVALGTLLGPCQVGARVLDLLAGRFVHPMWEMLASTLIVAVGLRLVFAGGEAIIVGIVLYGGGIGLRSIVRGTLPLALFGAEGYASLIGRLAFPMLLAQAAAPSLGAVIIDRLGAHALVDALFWAAIVNIALALMLLPLARRR